MFYVQHEVGNRKLNVLSFPSLMCDSSKDCTTHITGQTMDSTVLIRLLWYLLICIKTSVTFAICQRVNLAEDENEMSGINALFSMSSQRERRLINPSSAIQSLCKTHLSL